MTVTGQMGMQGGSAQGSSSAPVNFHRAVSSEAASTTVTSASGYAATVTHRNDTLPELPSAVYQYSKWLELDECKLKGSMLHSPRIRDGPEVVPASYAASAVPSAKSSGRWRDYRNTTEDWEHAEEVNLSYQDLGDPYQIKNFHRCIRRLARCQHLQLVDNSLTDLGRITLPSCTHLNLSRNRLSSLKKLPHAPKLEHLSLHSNSITSLSGLSSFSKSSLKSLVLKGNPVEFTDGYRRRVFKTLPNLESLDGYPRLTCDLERSSSSSSSSSTGSEHTGSQTCTLY